MTLAVTYSNHQTFAKMEFQTIDSKIKIEKGKLFIKKVKFDPTKRYWFDSFILIGLLIAYQVDGAINGKPHKWIIVIAALTWIYPHLERIFKILFVYKWGNYINLKEVREVEELKKENELETNVALKFKSGRRKVLVFRTAEQQADKFIDAVKEFSSASTSLTKGYS